MSEQSSVPFIPESAPLSSEQRAYLNGFFAGLFSRAPFTPPAAPEENRRALLPLSVLFASQSGNAENLAKRIAREAGKRGFAPTVHHLGEYPRDQLPFEKNLLLAASTYGDGEPPESSRPFWEFLASHAAPLLPNLQFSVCALGDSNYPQFCAFGKNLDARLEALGARRVTNCVYCDVDFERPFLEWLNAALDALAAETQTPDSVWDKRGAAVEVPSGPGVNDSPASPPVQAIGPSSDQATFTRNRPFFAAVRTNRTITRPGSAKETRHFELSIRGSNLTYEVGDALGVWPENCPELAGEIIAAAGFSGEETVPAKDGMEMPLRDALIGYYDLVKIRRGLLEAISKKAGAGESRERNTGSFLPSRPELSLIDLLLAHPELKFAAGEFVGLLSPIQPRLYSISSSPKVHPLEVHLTVGIIRYQAQGRARKGVCSTFLADRVEAGSAVPVFIQSNKHFRPPPNGDTPMIMVGPGTGIAPFRGFLQERRARGAPGKNWLFFGEQHVATDFLYGDELESMLREGTLARLDTAFSRDGQQKVYVQHRMLEQGRELFRWLEEGAHFYVCGDAKRMARDVEAALHDVIVAGSGWTMARAVEYVAKLRAEKRYQRDVY